MSLLEHVAMAIDFSEPSKIALAACYRMAELTKVKKLTLMHSVQTVVLPAGDQAVLRKRLEDLRARIHDGALANMKNFVEALPAPPDVELEYRVVEGAPARAIPEAAVAVGATLLAVGTHSRKGLARWLRGSVAETIVRGAMLPVIVMPVGDDGVAPEAEIGAMKNVLVAVDVHAQAGHVVAAAIEAAKAFEEYPRVTLLTVDDVQDVPYGGDDPEAMNAVEEIRAALAEGAEQQLEALAARYDDQGVQIDRRVVNGDPDQVIVEVAKEIGASLIVIGTHGRNEAPLVDMGSTTAHILRSAGVSVLVVPSHPDHH